MLGKFKYILIFLIFPYLLFSQASDGAMEDFFITKDKDTVLLHRTYGTIKYGIFGGANGNIDLGTLKALRKPYEGFDSSRNKRYIDYVPKFGAGYFIGIMGEWQPANSFWGAVMRVYIIDNWSSTAQSPEFFANEVPNDYNNTTEFTYFTVSPSVKYNLFKNFNIFCGMDIGINLSYESVFVRKHVNIGDIKHSYEKHIFKTMNTRFGGNIGVGYEWELSDINHRMRLLLAPFISIHAGNAMVTDEGSSWNTITSRIGVTFKFGPDKITYDTLPYIPSTQPPPVILASLDRSSKIDFDGITIVDFTVGTVKAGVDRGQVEEETRIEPIISLDMSAKTDVFKNIEEKAKITLAGSDKPKEKVGEVIPKPKLEEDKDETYTFTTSASTELTVDIKKYLDQVAVYISENPGAQIGITGHSDDQGTFAENDERARKRAMAVRDYLIKKGIPASRLLANGKGSIEPIASNKTEAGKRKNRRVDIRIVPSAKRQKR